jgi:hypothetical protein
VADAIQLTTYKLMPLGVVGVMVPVFSDGSTYYAITRKIPKFYNKLSTYTGTVANSVKQV